MRDCEPEPLSSAASGLLTLRNCEVINACYFKLLRLESVSSKMVKIEILLIRKYILLSEKNNLFPHDVYVVFPFCRSTHWES